MADGGEDSAKLAIAARLRAAVKLAGGQKKVTELSGVPLKSVSNYTSGAVEMKVVALPTLARACGVSVEWLATGRPISPTDFDAEIRTLNSLIADTTDAKTVQALRSRLAELPEQAARTFSEDGTPHHHQLGDDFVLVPRFDIRASAGAGAVVHSEQIVDYLAFKREWVRRFLGLPPEVLALIQASGDSMEPTIGHGDLLLLNTAIDRVKDDAVYALSIGGDLVVKRIQRHVDGTVTVKSDNPRYQPEELTAGHAQSLRIVGQVIWGGRTVR